MAAEAPGDDPVSRPSIMQDVFVDGLAQGCSPPEAATLCGLSPEHGARLLEQPEVRRAVRRSHAALATLVQRMDLEAVLAQPADSNVVSLWAWHALRGSAGQ